MLQKQFILLLLGAGLIKTIVSQGENQNFDGFGEKVTNFLSYYLKSITSGNEIMKKDAYAQLQPYSSMEKQLVKAPLAVGVLGTLQLIAASKKYQDFALEMPTMPRSGEVKFERLKWPGSFAASLSQISTEGWKSFQTAHLKMYEIEQQTAFFSDFLEDAISAVMLPDDFPADVRKNLVTDAFEGIMNLANKTEGYIVEVDDSFTNTSLSIEEMIASMEQTKGSKENARKMVENLIQQRKNSKNAAMIRLDTITKRKQEKEEEAEFFKAKWLDAQEDLKNITEINSRVPPLYDVKETPIYAEKAIIVKETQKKKTYSAYRQECQDPGCQGDTYKSCPTIYGESQYCSLDDSHDYRGKQCKSACALEGKSYYWCYTNDDWGYCSPNVPAGVKAVVEKEKYEIGKSTERFLRPWGTAKINIPKEGFLARKKSGTSSETSESDEINQKILKIFKISVDLEVSKMDKFFDKSKFTIKNDVSINDLEETWTRLNDVKSEITESIKKGGDKLLLETLKNILGALKRICKGAKKEVEKRDRDRDPDNDKISGLIAFLEEKKNEVFLVNEQNWENLEERFTDASQKLDDQIIKVKEVFEGLENIFDTDKFEKIQSNTTEAVAKTISPKSIDQKTVTDGVENMKANENLNETDSGADESREPKAIPVRGQQAVIRDGCPKNGEQWEPKEVTSDTQKAAVRCCKSGRYNEDDADKCKTNDIIGCHNVTLVEAKEKCAEHDMRLCFPREINDNNCCETGCGFDDALVWQNDGWCATMFEKKDFQGWRYEVADSDAIDLRDDKMRSVKVRGGCKLELYEQEEPVAKTMIDDIKEFKKEDLDKFSSLKCSCSDGFFSGHYELKEVKQKVDKAIDYLKKSKPEIEKIGYKGRVYGLASLTQDKTDEMIQFLYTIEDADTKKPDQQKNLMSEYKDILEQYKLWMQTTSRLTDNSFGVSKADALFANNNIQYSGNDTLFEATGKYAQEIVNAYSMSLTHQLQFEKLRDDADQAFQQTLEENRQIEEAVNKLFVLNASRMTDQQILASLREGLQALLKLQDSWRALLTMFGEIKATIQNSLQESVNILTKGLDNTSRLSRRWIKKIKQKIYRDCYKASILVYIVQKQANLYYRVSNKFLLPALNDLGKIVGLDAENAEDRLKIQEKRVEIKKKTEELPEKIKKLIGIFRSEFQSTFKTRLETVTTLMNEIGGNLPETVKEKIEIQVEETDKALSNPFDDDTDDCWIC